jgi:hypothetical protein
MIDESLLEIIGDNFGLDKHWQWLFKIEDSSLWQITPIFMTKEKFLEYLYEHNTACPRNKIIGFGKAKITKRLFDSNNLVV